MGHRNIRAVPRSFLGAVALLTLLGTVKADLVAEPDRPVLTGIAAAPEIFPPDSPSERTCGHLVPGPVNSGRTATVRDLVGLRDFGPLGLGSEGTPGFDISPDGHRLAVQVRQADAATNAYCQAVLSYDLQDPVAAPKLVSAGGDFVRQTSSIDGLSGFASGVPVPLTPKWSPDGRRIAFLRRQGGRTRLVVAGDNGSSQEISGDAPGDVVDFSWNASGRSLYFDQSDALQAARAQIRDEATLGYRYDDRFWMLASTEPYPRGSFEPTHYRVDISPAGVVGRPQRTDRQRDSEDPGTFQRVTVSVSTDPEPKFAYLSRLHVRVDGRELACPGDLCINVSAGWYSPDRRQIVFLRREGWALGDTAIYAWDEGAERPTRLLKTEDGLSGCILATDELVCGRERSAAPRDIVAIGLRKGSFRQLVDLNPEWDGLRLGSVTRLHWRNRLGLEAMGDLVMPPVTRTGGYPLVVVQYDTRGFLRGGTGDEYPIQAIAAAGFAVLSLSRPMDLNTSLARSGKAFNQGALMRDWADRASVHDSLLQGIAAVRARIPIDPDHIAITGLSDGASTASYALIHSDIFSLALLSTCCEDPQITTTEIGPAYSEMQAEYQYALPWEENRSSWEKISLAMNAGHICARIFVQAADREARMSLASFAALREHHVPIEMYIYPDEYHIKWQPSHRAMIYARNLETLRDWVSRPRPSCPASARSDQVHAAIQASKSHSRSNRPL